MMKKVIQCFFKFLGYNLTKINSSNKKYDKIYEKYKDYTMVPYSSYIENLRISEKFVKVKGDIIECGTWKGGMIAGMAEIIGDYERTYYLFDSFEGLPDAKEIDGMAARLWQKDTRSNTYHNNCKADIHDAAKAMKIANISNPQLIKGWFNDTLPKFQFDNKIAILRLDGDWFDSILLSMEYLYPKVVKGGLVIIDDYYVWEGTSKAVHFYLNKINSVSKISELCGGIAYIIKNDD